MSVANNQTGAEGNKFEFIAKNKVTTIGISCPNLSYSVRMDRRGKSTVGFTLGKSTGSVPIRGAMPSASIIDTSVTHPQGSWWISIANKWDVTVGAGGINYETRGPLQIFSEYGTIIGKNGLNLQGGELVEIKSDKYISINAPKVLLNDTNLMCNASLKTTGNMVANGGFYARGETYITHMTTQSQNMNTKDCDCIDASINPTQSFAVKNGSSALAQLKLAPYMPLSSLLSSVPDTPGMIDAVVTLPFPPPIDAILTLPIKLAFTRGIQLISDNFYSVSPAESELVWNTSYPSGYGLKLPDVVGGEHSHEFTGPAATYLPDTNALYEAAADSGIMDNKAIGHNQSTPGGGLGGLKGWFSDYCDGVKKSISNKAKKRFKRMIFGGS